ncbi:MAG: hypothetical protein DHS20C01_38040 [marine bacterium B5-7]|nr:MAG: hypothetical protein DHS20C01_38040 [marine bacterium B5-7]
MLPAHAQTTTISDCSLRLSGCTLTCETESGTGQFPGYYMEYTVYTLEVVNGCPVVARRQPSCCEYDGGFFSLDPGPNQVLIACIKATYEQAATFAEVSVTLPNQSEPYARGRAECGTLLGQTTGGGTNSTTFSVDGVPMRIRTTISVGAGMVSLDQVSVTPA